MILTVMPTFVYEFGIGIVTVGGGAVTAAADGVADSHGCADGHIHRRPTTNYSRNSSLSFVPETICQLRDYCRVSYRCP